MSSCHYAFHYPLPQPPFVIHRAKPKTQRHRHPHTARNRNRLEWANPGRLCARLPSIHFCLSVNNMASCVCVVVLTTAASSPLPPPAVAMSLYGACGLHCAALRCIGSFQFTPRVPAPARKVQLAPRQTRRRRRERVADPAESAMCRLGKIVLGFAALILPSLKCSRRSRNQSAKSAKRRELREGNQVARLPGPA